jgi:hypothetical protein
MSVRLFNDVLIGGTLRLNELSGGGHPAAPTSGGVLEYALSGRLYGQDVSGTTFPIGLTSGSVLSGMIGSGQVGNHHIRQGSIRSGHMNGVTGSQAVWGQAFIAAAGDSPIVQYSIGNLDIASGNNGIHWHNLGSGAVLSGAVASGQVGPYHLGSGSVAGSWPQYPGKALGASYVTTNETTTSATAADLTTTQHVTFNLDVDCDVIVQASCATYNSNGAAVNVLYIDVDGTDTDVSYEMFGVNKFVHMVLQIKVALTAGAHTIKLQFGTNAGTANFQRRTIVVSRAS